MELTFALPQFVKLMYIIHHAFTAIKKNSHVDCSGLAVRFIKLKEQIFADEVVQIFCRSYHKDCIISITYVTICSSEC